MMTITSTYDHRVIQGAESGSFLRAIDGLLAGAGDFYPDVFSSLAADFAKAPPIEGPGRLPQRPACGRSRATSTNDLKAVAAAVALVRAYRSLRAPGGQARSAGQPAARRPGAGPGAAGPDARR